MLICNKDGGNDAIVNRARAVRQRKRDGDHKEGKGKRLCRDVEDLIRSTCIIKARFTRGRGGVKKLNADANGKQMPDTSHRRLGAGPQDMSVCVHRTIYGTEENRE